MNKQKARTQRGAVMMEYVILVMMLALALFAGNNYLTNDSWLEDELFKRDDLFDENFQRKTTSAGPPTLGKDVAGMYQRVMAGICLPTP
jgi:hypothetical protein